MNDSLTEGSLFIESETMCADISVWEYSHSCTLKHKQIQLSVNAVSMCVCAGNGEQA